MVFISGDLKWYLLMHVAEKGVTNCWLEVAVVSENYRVGLGMRE